MPGDIYLFGYADDIAALATAGNTEDSQRKLNQVMIRTDNQLWSQDGL